MKIAIIHDYIKEYGGAERVLEELIKLYPRATLYTTVYLPKYLGPHRERFAEYKIRTSFLQYIPFKAKLISPFRVLSPLAFKLFNFSDFDLIIVSQTGAYFPNVVDKEKAVLITYTHTPPRYLYGFATARQWKKNAIFRFLGETANHFLRLIDFKAAQNVDYFIANSENVAARIEKFYKRNSVVIYPPAAVKNSKLKNSESYFLAGGRLARPKHIDLIVWTFTKLKLPLVVFGKEFAGYGAEIRKMAGENIEFVGEISDAEKLELMRNARAYIFASEDEDFGITPVEAMAGGIPVIAYKSGGVLETIIDEKTGVFFNRLSVGDLTAAINKFQNLNFDKNVIIEHARKFSAENFDRKVKAFVSKVAK